MFRAPVAGGGHIRLLEVVVAWTTSCSGVLVATIVVGHRRRERGEAERERSRCERILREQSVIDIDEYREKLMAGSETSQSPEAETMRTQIAKLLERAVANLPEALRPVFVLREIEGLSVEETAEALQIPTGTVKTRLMRSRHRLQRELDPEIREALQDTFPFAGRDCDALTERVLAKFLSRPASDR